MDRLLEALSASKNPNLQDIGSIPPVTGDDAKSLLLGALAGSLGTPVDLMTMAMRPFGYDTPPDQVYGSSDWIGSQLGADTGSGAFLAGQFTSPDPLDALRAATHMQDFLGAMTVFHGSPHKWDRVDLSKVGTGEGAQAYGHGFYAAESPDVAKSYLGAGRALGYDARQNAGTLADVALMRNRGDSTDAINELEGLLKSSNGSTYKMKISGAIDMIRRGDAKGPSLYELDIPDEAIDKMLDWDKPLSEQPEAVRQAINRLVDEAPENAATDEFGFQSLLDYLGQSQRGRPNMETMRGEEFYQAIADAFPTDAGGFSDKYASEFLNSLGIPGIKYLDGTSRKAGEGTRNFVIFDENAVTTLKRNGEPIK